MDGFIWWQSAVKGRYSVELEHEGALGSIRLGQPGRCGNMDSLGASTLQALILSICIFGQHCIYAQYHFHSYPYSSLIAIDAVPLLPATCPVLLRFRCPSIAWPGQQLIAHVPDPTGDSFSRAATANARGSVSMSGTCIWGPCRPSTPCVSPNASLELTHRC